MSRPPAPTPSEGWGPSVPSPYDVAEPTTSASRGGVRRGLLVGVAVVAVAAVGGGVWAATSFLGAGEQPAEMLPADTVAYVAIDLDPSGSQKLAALQTLQKFPALESDLEGLGESGDLKEVWFDHLAGTGRDCEGRDYDEDLAPWLGDRAGLGFLVEGDEPSAVGVFQVADVEAAEDGGLDSLVECIRAADERREYAWVVEGDWAVVAYDEAAARQVVESAREASLAESADFRRWTEAAGDPGVVTAYAGPRLDEFFAADGGTPAPPGAGQLVGALEDFEGAALTVRFADEGLEVQSAFGGGDAASFVGSDVTDLTDELPSDTAALLAADLEPGWAGHLLDRVAEGSGVSRDTVVGEIEGETGIAVPDDLERLLGEGVALTVSSDVDAEGVFDGSTPPDETPVGVRVVTSDPEGSSGVLDALLEAVPEEAPFDAETGDDLLVVSPDQVYRAALLEGGDLGSQERFDDVLPMIDRSGAVLYVDLDVIDDYRGLIDDLSGDQRVAENLEPLSALGLSSWAEDDATHLMLRISTG